MQFGDLTYGVVIHEQNILPKLYFIWKIFGFVAHTKVDLNPDFVTLESTFVNSLQVICLCCQTTVNHI